MESNNSKSLIGIVILGLVVVAILAGGMIITGNPLLQKYYDMDNRRMADFSSLYYEIQTFYSSNNSLPPSLDTITLGNKMDPYTHTPYIYKITGDNTFDLCTVFSADSEPGQSLSSMYTPAPAQTHKKGYGCISYTLPKSQSVMNPTPYATPATVPTQVCGGTHTTTVPTLIGFWKLDKLVPMTENPQKNIIEPPLQSNVTSPQAGTNNTTPNQSPTRIASVIDSSDQHNNGQWIGPGASQTTVGSSTFNGTSDFVYTDMCVDPQTYSSVTFEAWVKPASTVTPDKTYHTIMAGDDGGYDRGFGIRNGFYEVQVGDSSWVTGVKVVYDTWSHVAVTYSPSSISFYYNGKRYNYGSSGLFGTSLLPLSIGGDSACGSCFFAGEMKNVRVYNYALNAAQVTTDVNSDK